MCVTAKVKPPRSQAACLVDLDSAAGAAGILDILANEIVLVLLMESGILATINASRACRRLYTLARVVHGQQELTVRACDDTIACAVYVARCRSAYNPGSACSPLPFSVPLHAPSLHASTHSPAG